MSDLRERLLEALANEFRIYNADDFLNSGHWERARLSLGVFCDMLDDFAQEWVVEAGLNVGMWFMAKDLIDVLREPR